MCQILAVVQNAAIDERERQKNFNNKGYKVDQTNRGSEYRHEKSHSEVPPSIFFWFCKCFGKL